MKFPALSLAFVVSLTLGAAPCRAAIDLDLSYVDQQSEQFQRFKTWVDQAVAGDPGYAFSATDATFMFRLTGQSPYATLAVQMVEAQVADAEAAIVANEAPEVAGDSYLHVGPMLSDLALTYDWCAGVVTLEQRTRWAAYAEQAVWNVWHPDQAQWGGHAFPWSGWSIDNPANNYYYSFVEATMYWGLAEDSTTWLPLLQNDKLPALEQYAATLQGGGSQEGTGYGLSHRTLFSLYRLWRDATGSDLANANSHLTDSIAWWIHATVPTLDRVAPIGDQSRVSVPAIYDYHRDLILEARRMTTDAAAQDHASWWLHAISEQEMQSGFNFRHDLLPAGPGGSPPAELIYHAPGTGQLFARTGWDTGAMWLQFSAGPYMESHAHQDQGSFTLFEGDWLAVTENIWSHSGIQQGTEVHNLVRFEHAGDIVAQRTGTTSTMTVTPGANGAIHVEANLTPAYNGDPAVQSWQRAFDFANRTLTIHDSFSVGAGTQAIFEINVPVQPTISGADATAGSLKLHVLSPANAMLTAVDWTTVDSDYLSGWRIDVAGGSTDYVVELSAGDTIFANGFE
ncbi:MAG: heparinase II/III family protein [Dokdonella sp.]